ncbi:S-adenosyl-L-methionine-dependent methyltransferase [Dinoroseobacter shibae DFL 12 = DSM 16493]|jgi:16S rRNA (cytosine1402-N4)-methyltransferase|uniref:Ribosomal RNA small subunit methyltransferase H n=1 Tax=Dinoroseobacter shibae (strain DSM 16493 / NCIMB 14021 / DFL 12) TaxID=398580 RepID=RSMH_DINSH|nr:16S rRNA (cytosine(1402)-N(4))-methyltransferase RsmH [Dinoroseobacter shibae]A8LSB5.1 RecName: Full=Ribosomal RNA small subunit methyltransferase H; AltName: Full=16S rRNA m(4)C1402 methyltransferase; AltName: Full=rRNA (cytosine-N(4)-)-methyltransferase RsmH [Dinoroseobacter shibae DFL 12 = DSM 16493]ABV94208.1 S-adenosyl-L-methionine-dependent methyltransferase [Dinoroseobacter shibae DFL 12 = DSM 16493]URF45650.1 16S rRNA (cytosine(1402)-N(4))-methyltransferase RsmH [Dinoroseobacter shiba
MVAAQDPPNAPHIPVLLEPILTRCAPITGTWLDGTFGAGGYARGLLEAGADRVIGVDQDPLALEMAADWAGDYGDRLRLVAGNFEALDAHAGGPLDGVVLDLGVSSMQLDRAERGFSFLRDGPLDMRMAQHGRSAADLVAEEDADMLADILFHLGEERAARRIARAIVAARAVAPITRTSQLAEIVASCLPRPKPGQSHAATRSFQALRIAVNDELGALVRGLEAAEGALEPGGWLAVVTFHSIEDRIVKRFFTQASGGAGRANRYAPETEDTPARFRLEPRKAIAPTEAEVAANPRARSARLRIGRRTAAPAMPADRAALGLPHLYTLTETP